MKAIILGAGYGTRLVEEAEKLDDKDLLKYIRSTPKPLLEVNGRPIINQLIDRLATSVPSIRIVANNYAPFFNAFNLNATYAKKLGHNSGRDSTGKDVDGLTFQDRGLISLSGQF